MEEVSTIGIDLAKHGSSLTEREADGSDRRPGRRGRDSDR